MRLLLTCALLVGAALALPWEEDYEQYYEQDYEQDYKQDYEQDYKQDYEQDYKQHYEHDYKQHYEQDYKQDYEQDYKQDYEQDYGQDYEQDYFEKDDWSSEKKDVKLTSDVKSGTTCACGWTNKGRIVGGKEAPKNAYPLIVALENRSGYQFCGGTIITPWHVVTAAHCTYNKSPSNIFINAGAHYLGGRKEGLYPVGKIVNHEKYDDRLLVNDISLLVTSDKISFNQNIGPACLPTSRMNLEGQTIKALGWGNTYNGGGAASALREVDLKVIGFNQCFNTWKNDPSGQRPQKETNLCTFDYRKDTCQGDSGGPLVWLDPATKRYTLVALVSYGGECGGNQAAPNTDVGAFLPWINKQIANTKPGTQACTKA